MKRFGKYVLILACVLLVAFLILWNKKINDDYTKQAQDALRHSGEGGYSPDEIIDALRDHYGLPTENE